AVRTQDQLAIVIRRIVDADAEPIGLEAPALPAAVDVMAFDDQCIRQQANALDDPRAAVVQAKHDVEEHDVEAAEAEDGPSAAQHEGDAEADVDGRDEAHEHGEAARAEAGGRRARRAVSTGATGTAVAEAPGAPGAPAAGAGMPPLIRGPPRGRQSLLRASAPPLHSADAEAQGRRRCLLPPARGGQSGSTRR